MKVSQKETDDEVFLWVKLTRDEERDLANVVMRVLSARWLPEGPFRDLTDLIYSRCCEGKDIQAEQLLDFFDKLVFWNNQVDKNCVILPPTLEHDDQCVVAPNKDLRGNYIPLDKRVEWYRRDKRIIWKEVWETHVDELKKINDCYRYFTGDQGAMLKQRDLDLRDLFLAADKTQDEVEEYKISVDEDDYRCPRKQALLAVVDRMPSWGLSIDELMELDPGRGETPE